MPTPRRKPDRVRVLELLDGCGSEGCAEAILLWHGVTIGQIVELVRAGLASVTAARVAPDNRTIDVARVRITAAGRRMLERARR
jgi:hypothetical protein